MFIIVVIHIMNINAKDLNLLGIFVQVMREKNLSNAGKRLGLSQPAMSHALGRLRRDFNDPLFVRIPGGVVPTPLALKLYPQIEKITEAARIVYYGEEEFNPNKIQARIALATTDYFEQWILPKLIPVLEESAPKLTVISRPLLGELPKVELEKGVYDLAIAGYFPEMTEGFLTQKLFEESFVCLTRRKHPRLKKGLTLDVYTDAAHVLITRQGDLLGIADQMLAKMKRKRHIAVAVSNFLSAGWLVVESDMILTCPSRLAHGLRKYLPLDLHEVPFKIPTFTIVQKWHERTDSDPLLKWFRRQLHAVCQGE